jgi:hypothetical protein
MNNLLNGQAPQEPNDSNNNNNEAKAQPIRSEAESAGKVADNLKEKGPRREKQWVRLGTKRSLVEEMRRRNRSPEEFAGDLIEEKRTEYSATTLRRWARDYDLDKADGGDRLLDKPRAGRPRKVNDQVLLATFPKVLKAKKRSVKSIYREINKWAIKQKLAMPSYATFRRYVKEMTDAVANRHMTDFKGWYEENEISISHDDGYSNDVWVTDASQLGITVIDGTELFQPWVVIFMDKSSRRSMGWMITKYAPNTDDVVVCLKHGMLPKNLHGVEWLGKPRCVHSDNGGPFISDVFRANLTRQGIGFDNSPVACPENNGRVERLFRTVGEEWISTYEGQICSRFVKGEGRAQARWAGLPDELDEWVNEYNFGRPHSALGGITPYKAWEKQIKDLSLIQIDCKKVDELIYVERFFKVGKLGVEITPGEFWVCEGMAGLRRHNVLVQMRPEGPSKGMKAYIGGRFLGELVPQNDTASVAKALKSAQANEMNNIQGLMRTVAKGFVRHDKVLGIPKGAKKPKASKTKPKPKPTPKSKGKAKPKTGNVFKATSVKKGNS